MSVNRKIGLELRNGRDVGRDPREMTAAELSALGQQPISPLRALRLRCIDCSGDSANEVRLCTAVQCPAWPFRMGKNPWRSPVSEARRNQARTLADRRAGLAVEQRAVRDGNASKVAAATTLPADIRAGQRPSKTREETEGPRIGSGSNPQHAERVEGGAK